MGKTIRIESLGHGKRLRLWVELSERLILVTHWYLFCKVNHHYSGAEGCSLPQTRSVLEQILLCSLFLFSRYFLLLVCVYYFHTLCLIAWLLLAPHIKYFIGVIFIEFTTVIQLAGTLVLSIYICIFHFLFYFKKLALMLLHWLRTQLDFPLVHKELSGHISLLLYHQCTSRSY